MDDLNSFVVQIAEDGSECVTLGVIVCLVGDDLAEMVQQTVAITPSGYERISSLHLELPRRSSAGLEANRRTSPSSDAGLTFDSWKSRLNEYSCIQMGFRFGFWFASVRLKYHDSNTATIESGADGVLRVCKRVEHIELVRMRMAVEVRSNDVPEAVQNAPILTGPSAIARTSTDGNVGQDVNLLAGRLGLQQRIVHPLELGLQISRIVQNPPVERVRIVVVHADDTEARPDQHRVEASLPDRLLGCRWQPGGPLIGRKVVQPFGGELRLRYVAWGEHVCRIVLMIAEHVVDGFAAKHIAE
uniref:Uncharacterized protein n=1 Tax=Anopheles coluzzii TaxID=1518534 RepID=A0A8W7PKK9_ANOCL